MKWYKITLTNGEINSTVARSKKDALGNFIYNFGRDKLLAETLTYVGRDFNHQH